MILLTLGYFRSLGVENVCLKIAQLVEMAEAGFEPTAHFEPCPPPRFPQKQAPGVSIATPPRRFPATWCACPCGDVITQRPLT